MLKHCQCSVSVYLHIIQGCRSRSGSCQTKLWCTNCPYCVRLKCCSNAWLQLHLQFTTESHFLGKQFQPIIFLNEFCKSASSTFPSLAAGCSSLALSPEVILEHLKSCMCISWVGACPSKNILINQNCFSTGFYLLWSYYLISFLAGELFPWEF